MKKTEDRRGGIADCGLRIADLRSEIRNPKSAIACCLALLLLASCCPKPPAPYHGPTQPLAQVVEQINANNAKIPTLWASAGSSFVASIVDAKGKTNTLAGELSFIYAAPREMRLLGSKDLVGQVFELGSSRDEFWMIQYQPEKDSTMWWGRYANLGKPCARKIPIEPDLIVEVLAVGTIDTDLTRMPAPVLRFNNDQDVYMLLWVTPIDHPPPARLAVQKEVWYDRQTLQPKRVLLFDADGREVLRAYLSEHVRVEVPDMPKDQWPWAATRYDLYFPDTGSKIDINLSDLRTESRKYPGVPRPGTIRRPDSPDVAHIIQIDADCHD